MTLNRPQTFAQRFNAQFYPTIHPHRLTALLDHIDPDWFVDFDHSLDAIVILFSDGSISVVRGEPQGTFH